MLVQRDGVDYEVVDFHQRCGVNMGGLRALNGGALRYVTAAIFAADFERLMTYTNPEILVRGCQVEVDTDYGHFAPINHNTVVPSNHIADDEEDDIEPVTFNGRSKSPGQRMKRP